MTETTRWLALAVLCSGLLAGCGMRSVLETDVDGLESAEPDAGASLNGAGTSGSVGGPCGHGGMCDPQNLGGETCALLGAGSGTLSCDAQTCTFDLSLCTGAAIGSGVGSNGTGNNNNGQGGTGASGTGNNGQGGTGALGTGNNGQGGTGALGTGNNGQGGTGGGGTAGTAGTGFFGGGGGTAGTGFFGGGGTAGSGG